MRSLATAASFRGLGFIRSIRELPDVVRNLANRGLHVHIPNLALNPAVRSVDEWLEVFERYLAIRRAERSERIRAVRRELFLAGRPYVANRQAAISWFIARVRGRRRWRKNQRERAERIRTLHDAGARFNEIRGPLCADGIRWRDRGYLTDPIVRACYRAALADFPVVGTRSVYFQTETDDSRTAWVEVPADSR